MRVAESDLFDLPDWHARLLDNDQREAWLREQIRRNDAARELSTQLAGYASDLEYRRGRRVVALHRRQKRMRAAPINDLTADQWLEIQARWAYRCAYCGDAPPKLSMDHVVSIARGGSHTAANIVPACLPCNRRKGTGPAPPFCNAPE